MVFKLFSSRSAMKSLTWRIVASLTTMAIAWIVTGSIDFALSIGGIEVVAKLLIYYLHERIWDSVPAAHPSARASRAVPVAEDED